MRDFLFGRFIDGRAAVGLFAMRAVAGAALTIHGWPKIQNMMSWMGPESTIPGFMQALAAIAEFGGGIALIFGFLTPIAAILLIGNFIGALVIAHFPANHPFVNTQGGPSMELPALYLAAGFMYLLTGPGTWSLDALLFGGGRIAVEEHAAAPIHLDRAA